MKQPGNARENQSAIARPLGDRDRQDPLSQRMPPHPNINLRPKLLRKPRLGDRGFPSGLRVTVVSAFHPVNQSGHPADGR
jgi:hypothetical protein